MSLLDTASLIVTPNGYKEGKLYSVIPSYGSGDMSVVRATTATRVNSAGLVELVPYNLLGYSQDFSNAYWFGEPGNTITSNTTTAPDGTLTADTFTATASNVMNVHNFSAFALADGTFTYSVYLKNNGTNLIEAYLFKIGSGFAARGEINFSAGTFTASVGTGNIENVGNGWYRVSLTNTYTAGTFTTGTFTTSTTGTRSVFAWGAQLNEGTLKDYQKTETRLNIPRLDYSNGTCPSLLVEPQRTNLLTYSSSFSNWSNAGGSVTENTTIAPDGTLTADTLNGARFQSGFASNQYTASCFAKKVDGDNLFQLRLDVPSTVSAVFNLNIGTVVSVPSGYSATITSFENEWYLCSITTPPSTAISNFVIISASASASSTFVWGAQLEAGSYPTSYIPTTSASVTRNADVISKTGISSFFGTNQGTFFCDFIAPSTDLSIAQYIFDVSDGTNYNVNRLAFYKISINEFQLYTNTGTTITINANTRNKVAIVWNGTNVKVFANGSQQASITYANTNPSKINLGSRFNNIEFGNVFFNASASWSTALSDTQLATLTTL